METKKLIVFSCLILLSFGVAASAPQKKMIPESKQYIHKNLLRSTLTYDLGYMPKIKFATVYLQGNIEYYLDKKISLRGDNFINVASRDLGNSGMKLKNHQLSSGIVYHFTTNSRFDPFIGVQPGIAFTKYYRSFSELEDPGPHNHNYVDRYSFNPIITPLLGFNLYGDRYFHLFVVGRYVYGQYTNLTARPASLSEFRISFGLGFNLF